MYLSSILLYILHRIPYISPFSLQVSLSRVKIPATQTFYPVPPLITSALPLPLTFLHCQIRKLPSPAVFQLSSSTPWPSCSSPCPSPLPPYLFTFFVCWGCNGSLRLTFRRHRHRRRLLRFMQISQVNICRIVSPLPPPLLYLPP